MGYETKLIIGKATSQPRPELERDLSKPYSDGSGFECKMDDKGRYVETGRLEYYFSVYATIDLCKLGYQDDALNRLAKKSHKGSKSKVYFFYEGDKEMREDCYGEKMFPVPVAKVLKAMKASIDPQEPYRRLEWAIALLESMVNDSEEIQVLFYGH